MSMMRIRKVSAALLLAPVLMFAGATLPSAAMADPPAHGPMAQHDPAKMREHMQQHIQRHLDHLAARLEIRASQQQAWNAFASTVRGMVPEKPLERPSPDADAATRARMMADRVAEHARKLAQLADATAKLEQALDAPQKQVLDEVAREFGEHLRMRGMHRMHGEHGPGMHGGMHDGDHCEGTMHEGHPHHGDGHDMHGDSMHGQDRGEAGLHGDGEEEAEAGAY